MFDKIFTPENQNISQGDLSIGRVTNIMLSPYLDNNKTINPKYKSPSDIGKIEFEIMYQAKKTAATSDKLNFAWPISQFTRQYPVIGEIVLLVSGPSTTLNDYADAKKLYYFSPFNVWNFSNNNVLPNLSIYSQFLKSYYEKPGYNYSTTSSLPELPKGTYFTEKPIKNLQPFEGDSIIEGRFGQSIRFGSTSKLKKSENNWSNYGDDGAPITIIRNGQGRDTKLSNNDPIIASILNLPDQPTVENINYDSSSLYLTSGQEIIIDDLKSFPFNSYGITIAVQNTTRVIPVDRIPSANQSKSAKENDSI